MAGTPFILLSSPSIVSQQGTLLRVENTKGPGMRSASWAVPSSATFQGNRQYAIQLKVQTSSWFVGPLQIIKQCGLQIGDFYQWPITEINGTNSLPAQPIEQDTGSFLQSIKVEEDSEDGMQWKISLDYSPFDVAHELGVTNAADGAFSPLEMPPQVKWSEAKYERYKVEDAASPTPNPFTNTVNDPIEDPPKTEETRPVLTFVRNEITYSDQYASQFKDAVNSDTFLGYPPNTVKCRSITAERVYASDWGYYWPVTYDFEFRDDPDGNGYTELILNAGFRQLVSGTPQTIVINGAPISSPVPLTQAGLYTPGSTPYYLEFTMFPSIQFAQLNIPQDLFTVNQ